MADITLEDALQVVNSRLRPARITASAEGDVVIFAHARTTALENTAAVIDAVQFAQTATLDLPTAPYVKGHYEHYLTSPSIAARRSVREVNEVTSQDGALRCSIARPSLGFVLAVLRDDPTQPLRTLMGPGMMIGRRAAEETRAAFADAFLMGQTIRVTDASGRLSRADLNKIANSTLFNYAFGQALTWIPARSWDPLVRLVRHKRREEVQFPRRLYNQDLVAYYQLALSSESALLAYLSLYNVLEYFFSSATEQVLHMKLKELLVQPDFVHTKSKKLRDLVKLVRTQDQKHNELAALRLVIESKLDSGEVISWVAQYESAGDQCYTNAATLFGESVPMILTADQLPSSLAKRIYHLRCLLVHNKEAEKSRYLPFSQDDDIIRRELPLMMFIAEKLIISSGSELASSQ